MIPYIFMFKIGFFGVFFSAHWQYRFFIRSCHTHIYSNNYLFIVDAMESEYVEALHCVQYHKRVSVHVRRRTVGAHLHHVYVRKGPAADKYYQKYERAPQIESIKSGQCAVQRGNFKIVKFVKHNIPSVNRGILAWPQQQQQQKKLGSLWKCSGHSNIETQLHKCNRTFPLTIPNPKSCANFQRRIRFFVFVVVVPEWLGQRGVFQYIYYNITSYWWNTIFCRMQFSSRPLFDVSICVHVSIRLCVFFIVRAFRCISDRICGFVMYR